LASHSACITSSLQLRRIQVEFAVTLIDVDDDTFGVQPGRVLAKADGVSGLGP
jgi:hypothetical protein